MGDRPADLSLDRFERALRAARMGTWRWDRITGFVDWDGPMEELFGFEPGTFPGNYDAYLSRVHPADRPLVENALARTLATGRAEHVVEHRVVLPDGGLRWLSSTAALVVDDHGDPAGLIGVATDVTRAHVSEAARAAAEQAEHEAREAAERAQRRLALLARTSQLLAVPLDVDVTIQKVADLLVEDLADWCLVEVDDAPTGQRIAVGHHDAAARGLAVAHRAWWEQVLAIPRLCAVRQTLEPLVVDRVSQDDIDRRLTDTRHRDLVRAMGIAGVVAVPLVAQGRGIGTLILLLCGDRELRPGDVDLAMELGRRAGSAVEKARLYRDRDRIARTLQRSLRPPPLPALPGVDVAAAYLPWTAGVDVGGDYYDMFQIAGSWWLVLGDVCGKGPAAAALTTAVRYSLRALTLDDHDPVSVLARLNEVMLVGEPEDAVEAPFTTLVLAALQPMGDGVEVELASAGHPPPLLRRGCGTVESVPVSGMPVGLFPGLVLGAVRLRLEPGDALLFYTDGATEARGPDGDELGEAALRGLLEQADVVGTAGSPAREILDGVLAGVLDHASTLRDDLALVALVAAGRSCA